MTCNLHTFIPQLTVPTDNHGSQLTVTAVADLLTEGLATEMTNEEEDMKELEVNWVGGGANMWEQEATEDFSNYHHHLDKPL